MVNEPLPHQLTVGKLRKLIADAPDSVTVELALPPVQFGEHAMQQLCNLTTSYDGGPALIFRQLGPPNEPPVAGFNATTRRLTDSVKSALYWFVQHVSKGLMDDPRWEFDIEMFEDGRISWDRYISVITDPTVISTAYTIWYNNIGLDTDGRVNNEKDASFRAFQYIRTHADPEYKNDMIVPALASWELEEMQFTDDESDA